MDILASGAKIILGNAAAIGMLLCTGAAAHAAAIPGTQTAISATTPIPFGADGTGIGSIFSGLEGTTGAAAGGVDSAVGTALAGADSLSGTVFSGLDSLFGTILSGLKR